MFDRTHTERTGLANTAAIWFGAILLIWGILGFIPGITQMKSGGTNYLFGLFAVNVVHNLLHIVTGIVGLAVGLSGRADYARLFFLVFGIVYALIMIVGFIQGTTVLGIIPANIWDNLEHLVIAVVSFAVYFGTAPAAGRVPAPGR